MLQKNIKTNRPNSKLEFKKLEPFKIDKVILLINYKLILLRYSIIYPVFHILLLEPAFKKTLINTKIRLNNEIDKNKYKIKRILNLR